MKKINIYIISIVIICKTYIRLGGCKKLWDNFLPLSLNGRGIKLSLKMKESLHFEVLK